MYDKDAGTAYKYRDEVVMSLRMRQVHLDFHTSELIAGIGSAFDAEVFADTLRAAHVDSITVFARCHHGMLYYPSTRFPERVHPHLQGDLLQAQLRACRAAGIKAPIYITVQWDYHTVLHHPEWLAIDELGNPMVTGRHGQSLFEAGFYRFLCVGSPYRDFLMDSVRDLIEHVGSVDGLFFDIVKPIPCACYHCRIGMLAAGLDPSDAHDRQQWGAVTSKRFKDDMSALVRSLTPDATIFYNAGHVGPYDRQWADAYSHWEIETLPSGGWGYLHFPIAVRYARTLGMPVLGMTGKFHTSWGDFHSFKNTAALEFEVFRMLAHGTACSIGDQLHPDGAIDADVYDLIGHVYAEVERREPWCVDATPRVDIAVLSLESSHEAPSADAIPPATFGVVRMLEELAMQFDIIDEYAELSAYRVIILPDIAQLSSAFTQRIEDYVAHGGSLLLSHRAGLNDQQQLLACAGVAYAGDIAMSPDFVMPSAAIGSSLPHTEHAMYLRGSVVTPLPGTEVLAWTRTPYFERSWRHFISHRHTPSNGQQGTPAVTQAGRVIYFAHPVFGQYHDNAPRWVKVLVRDALLRLLPDPILTHDGPSTITTSVMRQAGRTVVHLLHYIPERRGRQFDVIEDVIPVYNVTVSVRADEACGAITLAPSGEMLPFSVQDGRIIVTVPVINGHAMVVLADA